MNDTPKEFQVRGYLLAATAAFLEKTTDADEAKRILEGLSPETRQVLAGVHSTSAAWQPVAALSEVLGAVATLGSGNEDRTRELLVQCGTFMAREATNTFLRLFMRMLTPNMFAKKLPDLWRRDCTHGKVIVEVGEEKFRCRAVETEGFLHAPCTITGFCTFTLETMGKSIDKTTIEGWSLQTPNPPEAVIELTWRN